MLISFGELERVETVWQGPDGVFHRILETALAASPGDPRVTAELRNAATMRGLHFDLLSEEDEVLAGQVLATLKSAVRKLLESLPDSSSLPEDRRLLEELLRLLEAAETAS